MGILKRILTIVTFFTISNLMGQTAEQFLKEGNGKINNQEYAQAIICFSKAIALNDKFKEAYKNRGISYSLTNQYNKAVLDFDQAILLSNTDYTLYNYRGMANFELANGDKGKVQLVIPDLENSLKLNPDYIEGYLNLSKVYIVLGNYEQAIKESTIAITKDKDNGKAYYDRGMAYYHHNNLTMACLDWKRAKSKGFVYADNALASYCE